MQNTKKANNIYHGLTIPLLQITEMLRKNPEDRPSAKEIFTTSLPLLASQFASNEYEEEEEEKDEMAKTHTKYNTEGKFLSVYCKEEEISLQSPWDHSILQQDKKLYYCFHGIDMY